MEAVRARLNPTLYVAGILLTLADANPDVKEAIRNDGGSRRAAERVARIMGDTLYKVTFKQAEKEREQNSFVTSRCG